MMTEPSSVVGKYKRFMPIAQAFAKMSKLPGTHVGCVILGRDFQVLASGWNGAPRGSRADVDQRCVDRDERGLWACHAEANAIANAARSGTPLNGSTAVVTMMPCMACAKSLVQCGVERVICFEPSDENKVRWGADFDLTQALLKECGVDLVTMVEEA